MIRGGGGGGGGSDGISQGNQLICLLEKEIETTKLTRFRLVLQ